MTLTLRNNPFIFIWTPFLPDNLKKTTFYTFLLFLFDAFRESNFDAFQFWTKITYDNVRQSTNYQAMNKGTGVFTAPLAGTYQFFIQVWKVSHFLLLTLLYYYALPSYRYLNGFYLQTHRLFLMLDPPCPRPSKSITDVKS